MVPRGIYARVRAAQGRGSRRGGSTARPAAARCLKVALRGKVKARPPRRLARAVADDLAPEARDMCPHALHTHCRGGPWRVVSQTFQKRAPKQRQGTQRRFFCSFAGPTLADAAPARTARHTAAPVLVHVVKVLLAVLDLQEGGGGGATGRCGCKGMGGKSAWRQGGKARCAPCARALVRHRGRDGGRIAPGRGAWRAAGLGGGGEQAHRLPGSPKKTTGAHQG